MSSDQQLKIESADGQQRTQEEVQMPQQNIQQPQHPSQPQRQQSVEAVVTSQPEKGSPPQVYPGGYPLPPYTQPYPGQHIPAYPMAPGMNPQMPPYSVSPNMVPVMPQPVAPNMMAVQQQTATNVNVNTRDVKKLRNWKANFCACCKDPVGCMGVLFCFQCFLCWLSTRMDESCIVPVFVPYALPALRLKFRTAQRIKGSICEDFLLTFCGCHLCMACQLKREYDMLDTPLNTRMQKIHAP